MKPHPLQRFTYVANIVFSILYLVLGVGILFEFIPVGRVFNLERWMTLIFGVGMILYAGVRLYKAYLLYREAVEE